MGVALLRVGGAMTAGRAIKNGRRQALERELRSVGSV